MCHPCGVQVGFPMDGCYNRVTPMGLFARHCAIGYNRAAPIGLSLGHPFLALVPEGLDIPDELIDEAVGRLFNPFVPGIEVVVE